jgi:hypothetical protein
LQKKDEAIRLETFFGWDGKKDFAVDKPDVLPPIDSLKPLNEKGEFVDKKIDTVADNAYYWRGKGRQVGLIMVVSGIGMLLLLLAAADKYQQGLFDLIALPFKFFIELFFGLMPKLW